MASLSDAEKCPRCKESGKRVSKQPSGNAGNTVHIFKCENSTCPWGRDPDDMGWIVELDPKGNVLERGNSTEKQFPLLKSVDEKQVAKWAEGLSQPVEKLDDTPEL